MSKDVTNGILILQTHRSTARKKHELRKLQDHIMGNSNTIEIESPENMEDGLPPNSGRATLHVSVPPRAAYTHISRPVNIHARQQHPPPNLRPSLPHSVRRPDARHRVCDLPPAPLVQLTPGAPTRRTGNWSQGTAVLSVQ